MTKSKNLILPFLVCLISSFMIAQSTTGPSTHRPLSPQAKAQVEKGTAPRMALPTTAEVDAYMKRSFGYDPGVSWEIYQIRESPVAGLAEIIVAVNKGQPYHL